MRVVALVGDQPNQRGLCSKIAQVSELVGIVRSRNAPLVPPPASRAWLSLAARLPARLFASSFVDVWKQLSFRYNEAFPEFPSTSSVTVAGINYPETMDFLKDTKPDLIVVSGTNMVGRKIIGWAAQNCRGAINLHTGISPYVRGGPNCTNWCLAMGWYHLIGNTVMWIDAGVDSGDLIATEQTPLSGEESLFDLHWKVMEHAHDLLCRAVKLAASGAQLPRVKQRTETGRCFKNSEWNVLQARKALRNLRNHYPAGIRDRQKDLELVSLLRL